MTLLIYEVEINKSLDKFITDTQERLKSPNFMRNPFNGTVALVKFDTHNNLIISLRSIYGFNMPRFLVRYAVKKSLGKYGYNEKLEHTTPELLIENMFKE